MAEQRVHVDVDDAIAYVRLNRPDKLNALDMPMFRQISQTIERLRAMDSLRCVVLSGEGPAFCAGIDLALLKGKDDVKTVLRERNADQANLFQAVAWGWRMLPVPVIAAVHGAAIGAGCQIMLGADVRIATPDAKISLRETYWGLVPDMAAFPLLKGLVREDVVRELVYTARVVPGSEAGTLGLVTHIADSPLEQAKELAQTIAAQSGEAVRAAKRLLNAMAQANSADLLHAESEEQAALLDSVGHVQAVAGKAIR
ncbi:putative enoyl-CoA hydratase [Caenibius tardaugens NBRC 16725]|uniref:Putative enoyl-CoA hydratase n=1 Tax=Caenibius tardaugens NBRC 16725 TaxID=1219035 RepID=U2YQ90_9SPHN|nr:crotonase/enoyl-CoA hydratase family protein [Caenibius tardaugens]AZI35507.1 crotonase/enoyl-CoA hydratase family protein [Caenibius tardaugens NBRC 16725]GAD51125.1 putative enoyl-CoA hydratase [Caenibius tardaugens NBRC 16725]